MVSSRASEGPLLKPDDVLHLRTGGDEPFLLGIEPPDDGNRHHGRGAQQLNQAVDTDTATGRLWLYGLSVFGQRERRSV